MSKYYQAFFKFKNMSFKVTSLTKWADFDPNQHMRHTAYNDYAAQTRVAFLMECDFFDEGFVKLKIGPILFREEILYFKEVRLGEQISVNLKMGGYSETGDRFRMVHQLFKADGRLAAKITVEGAWIDQHGPQVCVPGLGVDHEKAGLRRNGQSHLLGHINAVAPDKFNLVQEEGDLALKGPPQ